MEGIAFSYLALKNYEKAIEYLQKYVSVFPGVANPYDSMGWVYLEIGNLDEAAAKFKKAIELEPDFFSSWGLAYISALKEDYPEAIRWIDHHIKMSPDDITKVGGMWAKSFYLYWFGRLNESYSDLGRLIDHPDIAKYKRYNKALKASVSWLMAWIFLDRSEFKLCRECFKKWLDFHIQEAIPKRTFPAARKKHRTAWYNFYLGLVDLKQAKIESAKSRLVEINSLLPGVLPAYKDWIAFYYNFLQAEIYLAEGAVEKAINTCEKSSPLGSYISPYALIYHNVPFLKDVLARAYRQNGEIDKAIAEYKRLNTFDPQREERYLIHPKYYYRLAELYEQKGLKSKAIEHYEKFLDLWKDADPSIAEVEDARKRMGELKSQ